MMTNNHRSTTIPPADGFRQSLPSPRRIGDAEVRERAPLIPADRPLPRLSAAVALDTPSVPGLRIVSTAKKWWRARAEGRTTASATSTGNIGNGSVTSTAPSIPPPKRRRRVERVWPDVGTVLTANYHGQTYRAEVVPAFKPLKSGKQLRILTGSAAGRRVNSFARAARCATSRQRRENKLGVRGLGNAWEFWTPTGSAVSPATATDAIGSDAALHPDCEAQPCPMFRKNAG